MYETIIVGAGIAGITASIYASRKNMNYLVISKNIGGQILESGPIENYPGIVKTTGKEFHKNMQEQLDYNNVNVKNEEITEIKKIDQHYKIITNKEEYKTKTIIICSGAHPRKLDVPGEEKYSGKGVT